MDWLLLKLFHRNLLKCYYMSIHLSCQTLGFGLVEETSMSTDP